LFVTESLGHREALLEKLLKIKIQPTIVKTWREFLNNHFQYAITVARLSNGCELNNAIVIAESQLTGEKTQYNKRATSKYQDASNIIRSLTELKIGEAIVHIDHGVGRFLGLNIIRDAEFLTIEYAEQNKLYVPVTNLHLINRYGGINAEDVPLNNLGNDQWEKAREKAAKRAHDVAAELLELHAQRASNPGKQFHLDKVAYQKFADNFPFELTIDQKHTIEQIISDMTSDKAMDRLVCGDVGFGKTEVAMRAAFIAATNNKQVALLVPTTLLAQQHYETFKDRFADTAIQIEVLSRFNTPKEQQHILQNLHQGKVDIIIGTHKLLQENIQFYDLGLLIIDEEHRFGVRQKERIKAIRAEVDMLTLTATPIPRTLNMALSDVRDLSIIGTPPAKRLSVKTFLYEYDSIIIREAIMREIMRGGQVFYLHNNVKTIAQRARELQQLIPDAKIDLAHGQMPEKQLETIMSNFYHQRSNILLCTTIIENGIDIPTANTIIIERADKLGLAQLHQLRGRVGRSHHQAYAYLLTPPKSVMTKDAEKRLDAISSLEDLGIGFTLATHDLEIRGAGEFLGGEQSGHIQTVGFSLYLEFLERAVESLKSGKKIDFGKPLINATEMSLNIPTLIPESYITDVHTRLILYKRIANAQKNDELKNLQIEMIDRFGLLPQPAKNLFMVTELKLHAQQCDIHKVSTHSGFIYLDFNKNADVDPMIILQLIQSSPSHYKMDGAERLRVKIDSNTTIEMQLTYLFNKFCKK
jgi:transcription-repair coupling factor (superfamily II helicase)